MAGDLSMPESFASKAEMYAFVLSNLKAHVEGAVANRKFTADLRLITALSNASALLFYAMNAFNPSPGATLAKPTVNWVGFYLVASAQYLSLGPFQGKVACTQIKMGKGVCGTAALLGKVQCVPNVHEFPGHIACDSESESEIVVPIRNNEGQIVAVLDVDSTVLDRFDSEDVMRLTDAAVVLGSQLAFPNAAAVRQHGLAGAEEEATDAPGGNYGIPSVRLAPQGTSDAAAAPASSSAPPLTPAPGRSPPAKTGVVHAPGAEPDAGIDAPLVRTKHLGDWEFRCTRQDRIISAEEGDRWATAHGLGCLPEIIFPHNAFAMTFTDPATKAKTRLTIDAESFFCCAKDFYKGVPSVSGAPGESYAALTTNQAFLRIPVSEGWKNTRFESFDPEIDWASRSHFLARLETVASDGSVSPGVGGFVPATSPTEAINFDMLRRRDLEILFFDAFDIFEDDLHDCGVSKADVKFRVMPLCVFVLVRHVVRVDKAAAVCREVRLYYEYAASGSSVVGTTPTAPKVIAEVTHKHIVFAPAPQAPIPQAQTGLKAQQDEQRRLTQAIEAADTTFLRMSLDELCAAMQPSGPPQRYVLSLA